MTQVVWPPTCGQSTDVALVQKRLPGPDLGRILSYLLILSTRLGLPPPLGLFPVISIFSIVLVLGLGSLRFICPIQSFLSFNKKSRKPFQGRFSPIMKHVVDRNTMKLNDLRNMHYYGIFQKNWTVALSVKFIISSYVIDESRLE